MLYVGCSSCRNIAPFWCSGRAMPHVPTPTEPSPMGPFCGYCGVLPPIFMCGACGMVQTLLLPGMPAPPAPAFGGPQLVAPAMQAPAGQPPSRGSFKAFVDGFAGGFGKQLGTDVGTDFGQSMGTWT